MKRAVYLATALSVLISLPAWSQSITTDGNIETAAQLVSTVTTGTAPLAVSSTTMVPSLNADQVDGIEGAALALEADLQTAEAMLVALQSQVDALGLALLPRTGQTTCFDAVGSVTTCGTGIGLAQDGDLQLGVTWPNPRFTKNGDGTVTDNLTALIWLENANCYGGRNWSDALAAANGLYDGATNDLVGGDCGLTDSSGEGSWRLPNLRELQSLLHYGLASPALPDTSGTGQWSEGDPFSGVLPTAFYWSSTTYASGTTDAWMMRMESGIVGNFTKTAVHRVWPVRNSQ